MTSPAETPVAPRRRSILTNTAMNGIAQFASVISTLVFFPLLYQAFGAENFGVYIIASTVTGLAVLFDLGIGTATVRSLAEALALEDARRFSVVLSTSAVLLGVLGLVAAAIIAVIALVAPLLFNVTAEQAPLLTQLLLIGALAQVWSWPAAIAVHALGGLERYDLAARTSVMTTLGNVAVIGLVLLFGAGLVELMVGSVLVMIVGTLLNFRSLWRVIPIRSVVRPERVVASQVISSGLPIFVVGFTQFLNKEQADRLVVAVVLGPASVALYEIAAKLSQLITQVTNLPVSALLPLASAIAAKDNRSGLRELFTQGSRVVSFLIAPVAITLIVLTPPFVRVWFGDGFETSIIVARMLIGAQLFVPLYLVGDTVLMATGRFSLWVRPGLVLAGTNVVLSVILVQRFGLVGVAFGTLLAGLLELPVYGRMFMHETGVELGGWFRATGIAYALLPVAAVVAVAMSVTRLSSSLPGLALCGTVAVVSYWLAVWTFALSEGERDALVARLVRLQSAMGAGGRR